jgi:hypothetical protein
MNVYSYKISAGDYYRGALYSQFIYLIDLLLLASDTNTNSRGLWSLLWTRLSYFGDHKKKHWKSGDPVSKLSPKVTGPKGHRFGARIIIPKIALYI